MKRFSSRQEPDEGTSLLENHKETNAEGKNPTKYPRSVFFIVGNEFCERFSYYGMRVILILFLTNVLLYSEDTATVIYHAFTMGCYFTPLFGAMLADSLLGKFRTILYISILYCIGNIIISVAAVPDFLPMRAVTIIGLILIAIGTGGIKPCVSAFGGDQFSADQEKQLKRFFSLFYLSINSGSLVSTLLTPILRADVQCFGEETCFSLAFGVPAILMAVSLLLFIAGRPLYKILPPKGNIIVDFTRCISHAIVQRFKSKEKGIVKEHWLDYADDTFSRSLISDVKVVLRILLLYLPLPIFWALFDQQGSRWTLQATRLNGSFFGYTIKPDQINVLNPILIILMIPVFEYVVYPLFAKCNLLVRPLQRITVGGLLAAFSFVVAAILQLSIESESTGEVMTEQTTGNSGGTDPYILDWSLEVVNNATSYELIIPESIEFSSNNLSDSRNGPGILNGRTYLSIGTMSEVEDASVPSNYDTEEASAISILWQIPQHVILTSGEVMFSITGLEFSYSQAPESMKSVLQAAWLLTVAFGNLVVLIVANLQLFDKQSYEFFMFAGLMAVDMLLFAILAYFYKYVRTDSCKKEADEKSTLYDDKDRGKEKAVSDRTGITNIGYQGDNEM